MSTSSFCAHCGKQFSDGEARFCSACGAKAPSAANPSVCAPRLVRPRSRRMIAGVCAGVAIYYGWDLTVVRVLFAIFFCLSLGTGTILYLAGWVLLPDAQYALPAATQRQGNVV